MSEITNSEEQKTVQDPKKEILEELFGAVHEFADGRRLWPYAAVLARVYLSFTILIRLSS